jgi:hypothetical protein
MLAFTAAVCGQGQTTASTNENTVSPATGPNHGQVAAEKKSPVRFEGTDLILGKLPPITFHGFASQGFLASTTYNYLGKTRDGSFEFSEFGVNAAIQPFARTRVAAQAFIFDVGNVGEYNIALDYALVDYSFCQQFGMRAGRIRRPEGIYNSIQDIDLARTWVILPQGMYDARFRDFSASIDGGSLYGDLGLKQAGSLSYEFYGGMVNLSEQGGIARMLQDTLRNPPTQYIRVNGFPAAGLQLWWTPPWMASASATGLSTG